MVWLISRINLFLISEELNNLIYLIPSAIIYTVIILIIAYLFRKNKKLENLIFGIIVAIYTINLGLLSNLFLPLCNNELDVPAGYGIFFLVIVALISLLAIRFSYLLKRSYKWLILLGVFGFVHYLITSMTFYLNYIILYEYIYEYIVR